MNYKDIAHLANKNLEGRHPLYSNHFKEWEVREILKATFQCRIEDIERMIDKSYREYLDDKSLV